MFDRLTNLRGGHGLQWAKYDKIGDFTQQDQQILPWFARSSRSGWHVLDIHAYFDQGWHIDVNMFLIWPVKSGSSLQQLAHVASGCVCSNVITQVWTIKALANREIAFCDICMTTDQ